MQVSGDGGLGIVNPIFILAGTPRGLQISDQLTGWIFA